MFVVRQKTQIHTQSTTNSELNTLVARKHKHSGRYTHVHSCIPTIITQTMEWQWSQGLAIQCFDRRLQVNQHLILKKQ